jgi:hypothetical protein
MANEQINTIALNRLAEGASFSLAEDLTVTKLGGNLIVRENNGNQMWLFGAGHTFLQARDTKDDGVVKFDSAFSTWGDPHVYTDTDLDISSEAGLLAYAGQSAGRIEYDVMTNYTLTDTDSLVTATVMPWQGNETVVVNDVLTINYRDNNGEWKTFSADFDNGGDITLSSDGKNTADDLSATGKPLTEFAWHPENGDELFMVQNEKWLEMRPETFIDHNGQITNGGLIETAENFTFVAQVQHELASGGTSVEEQIARSLILKNVLGGKGDKENEEDDDSYGNPLIDQAIKNAIVDDNVEVKVTEVQEALSA